LVIRVHKNKEGFMLSGNHGFFSSDMGKYLERGSKPVVVMVVKNRERHLTIADAYQNEFSCFMNIEFLPPG